MNDRLIEQKLDDKEYVYKIYKDGKIIYCDFMMGLSYEEAFKEGLIKAVKSI